MKDALSEVPILRKRFDNNPRKRFLNSGMIEPKRRSFKGRRFDTCPAPAEATQDPLKPATCSAASKTSEFAYFKRLKQGLGETETVPSRNVGPANNEFGEMEFVKDAKTPMVHNKVVGSFLHPPPISVRRSSDVHSRVGEYTERLEPSLFIKTPTTIDLHNFLSTSATGSVNLGTPVKNIDIFSSKRLTLQRRISKTLFLEADIPTKELSIQHGNRLDVVSLLMSRLLPKGSAKIPPERIDHMEPQLKDKCQEHFRDSSIEFEECLDGTQKRTKTDVDDFLGVDSPAYWDTIPYQINEYGNICETTCADTMLLGFKEGSRHGNPSNEHWSDMFDDGNLLTWGNKTRSNIFKNDLGSPVYDSPNGDQPCTFRSDTSSHELPVICYDQYEDNFPFRNCLEFRHSWRPASSERFGSSALGSLRDTAKLDVFLDNDLMNFLEYGEERYGSCTVGNLRDTAELINHEIKSESGPLLLPWHSADANMKPMIDLTDMDQEVYSPPLWNEDNQLSLDSSTTQGIYPSVFPSSFMFHSSFNLLQDDHNGPRSNWAPCTLLYGPDQLSPYHDGLSKDVLRGDSLIFQTLGSDMGLKIKSPPCCIEEQYVKGVTVSQPNVCSMINVHSPDQQLYRISWLDTTVEASGDDLQVSTLGF